MNRIVFLLLFLASFASWAQSNLPACPEGTGVKFHNCYGTLLTPRNRIWPPPDRYSGEFRRDAFHGNGTYTWGNGAQSVSEFRNGKQHGKGSYSQTNGVNYFGDFKDGAAHGAGTFTHSDQKQYVGELRQWRRHGEGILYSANGDVLQEGYWENDQLIRAHSLDQTLHRFDPNSVELSRQLKAKNVATSQNDFPLADGSGSYEASLHFLAKVLQGNFSSGVKSIDTPEKCQLRVLTNNTIGTVKITNVREYNLKVIKSLRIQATETVPFGLPNIRRTLAQKWPYSVVFDGEHQGVAFSNLGQTEMQNFPQFNKPPSVDSFSLFMAMFENEKAADSALPIFRALINICAPT